MKRHLAGLGLTPAAYREKWGLSADYPMVAPNYAKQRSELAKSLGLGRKAAPVEAPAEDEVPAPVETAAPVATTEPKRRGRPRKQAQDEAAAAE